MLVVLICLCCSEADSLLNCCVPFVYVAPVL